MTTTADAPVGTSGPSPGPRAVTAGPAGPAPASLGHVRIRFAKLGKVRFTSHRDVARMWERALRRAGVAVAYSGGFSPHPLLSFGLALPTGCESTAEYVDVALDPRGASGWRPASSIPAGDLPAPSVPAGDVCAGSVPAADVCAGSVPAADLFAWSVSVADELPGRLAGQLPEGMAVLATAALAPGEPSLQQAVTSCTWRIPVSRPVGEVADRVAAALAAAELPVARERKGRRQTEDLRPSLLSVEVGDDGEGTAVLLAETATRPRGVRPSELADALGLTLGTACRTHQWIDRDGSREEPIVAGPAPLPQAVGCPS